MTRVLLALLASLLAFPSLASGPPKRPKITGISAVHFLTTSISQTRAFYAKILDPSAACNMCGEQDFKSPVFVYFASGQSASFYSAVGALPDNLLTDIFFSTDDLKAMKRYLEANKVPIESRTKSGSPIHVRDPEGHSVWFVEGKGPTVRTDGLPLRIIHAGFLVKDRASEDKFYRDILGFRPYWHGGMKDDETNWVSLQVPDGSDWLEYMLYDATGRDKHFRGVMNHFAVGVVDIQAEKELLIRKGWTLTEEPKIGRDGKWQLNVYDPDETRIEFMEFTPKGKTCCSEFTAPHPKP